MRDTVLEQYLAKMGFLRDDYIRFALLIIIDKMMISLYRIFQHEVNNLKLF